MPKGNPPRELSLVETCIGDLSLIKNKTNPESHAFCDESFGPSPKSRLEPDERFVRLAPRSVPAHKCRNRVQTYLPSIDGPLSAIRTTPKK